MPITKHNFTVRRVEELADTMRAAFRIAQQRPQGPRAGGYPQGCDRGGMRVHPQKAGADPHRHQLSTRSR